MELRHYIWTDKVHVLFSTFAVLLAVYLTHKSIIVQISRCATISFIHLVMNYTKYQNSIQTKPFPLSNLGILYISPETHTETHAFHFNLNGKFILISIELMVLHGNSPIASVLFWNNTTKKYKKVSIEWIWNWNEIAWNLNIFKIGLLLYNSFFWYLYIVCYIFF